MQEPSSEVMRKQRDEPALRSLAPLVLLTFVLTFIVARALVYLIMARALPDLFLFVGGTHVHHLNYGIFLLAGVGAFLLFGRPAGRALTRVAIVYGVGLGLTFDEFGMWLHLGGGYWQRASFDAVIVVASLLGLIWLAPAVRNFRSKHWLGAAAVLLATAMFYVLLVGTLSRAEQAMEPRMQQLEQAGPK